MKHAKDLTGQRFHRLVVLARDPNNKPGRPRWICRCDCGAESAVGSDDLRSGHTKSCGCYRVTVSLRKARERSVKHGMRNSPEYNAWRSMKKRCLLSTTGSYHRYGGRGVTVCSRWLDSFDAFYEDMGPRPSDDHSLDRIDNDGNYEPSNCRWATVRQQANNHSKNAVVEVSGKRLTVKQWADELGAPPERLYKRREAGWTDEEIIFGRSVA